MTVETGPPPPERTEETEAHREELRTLFEGAERRCVAVLSFHKQHPPTANPEAVASVWRETLDVLRSWRSYVERDDRWYGEGWPHDTDRLRIATGVALARALVDGTIPNG